MLMLFYLEIMELSEKDVVCLTPANPQSGYKTYRVFDLVETVKSQIAIPKDWLQGIPCELLKIGAPDWKKGKIRMRVEFEFISDEPEVPASEANNLDALRSKLDL